MKAILTVGMQGSGKSTWAKEHCINYPNYCRISRDDLRHMRGEYWMPKRENLITAWEYALIEEAIKLDYSLVIDEMNLHIPNREKLKKHIEEIAKKYNKTVEFELKDFTDVPLEVCIERDMKRPNSIGEKVLRMTYKKYLEKKIDSPVYFENPSLPHAIIVDLDGTLALFGDKNPYERDFINDDVNKNVLMVINDYLKADPTRKLIIFSGRTDRYKEETLQWLAKHEINPHLFDMRTREQEGMEIRDVEVKRGMFNKHIRGRFYIDYVLDDRNQVVDLWRSMGITCLQVNYGDF